MPRPTETGGAAVWVDRGILGCLFLMALAAPHSIAATQTGWLLGLVLWLIRFAIYPRPRLFRTPLDYVLLAFFILSGLSAFLSYEPIVSIGKMRAASLFTIVFLVAENVTSLRIVRLLALLLVASCFGNVLFTVGQFAIGKGVKVEGVKPDSPLVQAVYHTRAIKKASPVIAGDTIWEVNGHRVDSPEELATELAASTSSDIARVKIYRVEWIATLEVPRGHLLPGNTALEQLGITEWTRGRDWRATGFYGHWVTYSEVLQLIASLALGLFLMLPRKNNLTGALLLCAVAGFVVALGLTLTRASWAGFAISTLIMLLLSSSRRMLLIAGACAVPIVLAGVFILQQKRSVGFIDKQDQSTTWRQTVWSEGFHLLVAKPRHVLVGVGMDSIKAHWREWGLFDNGRLPMGHMHSNFLQIALERGIPTLIVWLLLLGIYARTLWRVLRQTANVEAVNQPSSLFYIPNFARGLALGALGGLAGFFASGFVHYNWGDSEVVMVLYFIMGMSLVVERELTGSRVIKT